MTLKSVKFSIIVPVYNVEKFLSECIASILIQTLKDFEVICVNDGSTDKSLYILKEYANKDSRFKIISQENQGPGIARNKAIDIAQGDYIVFIDPDDFIEPKMLEILNDRFSTTNVDIVQFNYITCQENGEYCGVENYQKRLKKIYGYSIKNNQIFNWSEIKRKNLQAMSLCVWDKAYKTDFIKRNRIRFAPNKHGEDHIFSISANLLANKILYVEQSFYHYRTRLGSQVNKVSSDNLCIFDNIELLKQFLLTNNLYEEYKVSFEKYMPAVLSWHYSVVPAENKESYINKCRVILKPKEYKVFFNKIKNKFSLLENIFSVKNFKIHGVKIKYLTIFGLNFRLTRRK